MTEVLFFIEVVVAGLLAGTMYSLVALGFVLIYKASSTFNFAQGAMVFFAVLAFVGFMELGLSFPVSFVVTVLLMVLVGFCTERLVLNPLMNQSEDTLLMATIGLGFVLEGLAQAAWGVEVRRLDLGIGDFPIEWIIDVFGLFVSALDVTAGIVAAVLIIGLALLFKYTRMGLGLRAVADDPGAASSIGIPLKNIMLLVWSAAGVVALVAGMMWGARAGVQFALVDLALKALPVLIIGGFSSIPGAIIGGLIIGATEKVLEVYLGPFFGVAIEGWAPYVLAIFFLLYRPEGLFGEKKVSNDNSFMGYTRSDLTNFLIAMILSFVAIPLVVQTDYWYSSILIPWLCLALAAIGQQIVMGYAGQLALGAAGFMAAGAFACFNLILRVPDIPFFVALGLSGLVAAAFGILFGLPSLRVRGIYLMVATLASQFFIVWMIDKFGWFKNYDTSGIITAQDIVILGKPFTSPLEMYLVILVVVTVLTVLAVNMARGSTGRNWMAVRDMDIAAESMGISLLKTKLQAFAICAFYCGVAGALFAFTYLKSLEPVAFDIKLSFKIGTF